jgi:ABC-type transporter Mla maintaining outer membrane lipid asymmetry ATPase subunit MlaF
VSDQVLELSDVTKDYRGLRPLRIERLAIASGESISIVGLDAVAAEVLVNLITGATLPDGGTVKVFGRDTATVLESADWLEFVDRFGIVSHRAVLLDRFSVIQNLALPLTLDVEPPPDDIRRRAESLAREVGLAPSSWTQAVAALDGEARAKVRLGRALALGPAMLLFEHATADVAPDRMAALARSIHDVLHRRQVAALVLTADRSFGWAVRSRVLLLDPATGRLKEVRRSWW